VGVEWKVWEMTEYVTGQIYGWNGGECPVHPKTKVEVWFRSGVWANKKGDAGLCSWDHTDGGTDIVCFQVVTPYAEPKVIYVNEYADGADIAYASEEDAKRWAHKDHTRLAVKYVEVKE
jgi:hypothetical protein